MKTLTAFQGENVRAGSLGRQRKWLWGSREKWGEEVSGGRSHSPKEEGGRAEWGHPRIEGGWEIGDREWSRAGQRASLPHGRDAHRSHLKWVTSGLHTPSWATALDSAPFSLGTSKAFSSSKIPSAPSSLPSFLPGLPLLPQNWHSSWFSPLPATLASLSPWGRKREVTLEALLRAESTVGVEDKGGG